MRFLEPLVIEGNSGFPKLLRIFPGLLGGDDIPLPIGDAWGAPRLARGPGRG